MEKVHIIGIGPGTREYLLPIAKKIILAADTLVGGKRQLSLFHKLKKKKIPIEGRFEEVLNYIKRNRDREKIAILVSGDPCLYSFLGWISQKLDAQDYEVIPGISSFQVAFARIKKTWQDALIISLHGRSIERLIPVMKSNKPIVIFTDYKNTPSEIASYILQQGVRNRKVVIAENLTYPEERISETDLKSLSEKGKFGLCLMIIK
jgi:cobalt-precorrin-7 (C5)-methyltransferase